MSEVLPISCSEILHQIKLDCQISSVIESITTRKAIAHAASEMGIRVEPEELQYSADNLRLISNLRSSEDTWLWLQKHSLTLDDFEELVEATVLSSKLAQHLFADKVEPFFVEHQLDYAQVVMYEVVLDDEDLAMELFYAIREGEINFHEVAHQYIQDPELRRAGGYLGILNRTQLKPEISAAVFAATPPQILKPIVSSKGVHLILVEELIQPQINNALHHRILADLFSQWLKQELEKFEVMINWNLDNSEANHLNTKLVTGVS